MLQKGQVSARLPAQDLARAKRFYAEKLGLTPTEERSGGLRYQCASGWFALFQSAGAPSGTHTQLAFDVDDIEVVVKELRGRGGHAAEYPAGMARNRWPPCGGISGRHQPEYASMALRR